MTELVPASPDGEIAETAERLAALDAAASEYLAAHKPPNTTRAYRQDWKMWRLYTTWAGIPETSATSGALVGFVRWMANRPDLDEYKPTAPTTVDRRLAGAVVGLRARGIEPGKKAKDDARDALKAYIRELAEDGVKIGRGKAAPLTVKHLRLICEAFPTDTMAGIRDRSLVLMAFSIAGRRSEVANLRVADIELHDNGLRVTVQFGKTGARTVPVPRGTHELTCPVLAWEKWKDASGITEGPAFRRVDRHGNLLAGGLSGQAVGSILNRAGRTAGLSVWITGHSARAGLATEARRAGHDPKTISATTGHSPTSRVLYEYMRVVDEWSDNALKGIGL